MVSFRAAGYIPSKDFQAGTMEMCSSVVLGGLVLLLLLWLFRLRRQRHVHLPPGPCTLPLLGNLHQIDKQAPFKTLTKWSGVYGPVMTVYLGPQRAVVLVGYEAVKEALVDQAEDFTGRAPVPFLVLVTRGYGLAISNGERWRQLRRFTLTTLRDFGMGRKRMEEWVQEESQQLIDSLDATKAVPFNPHPFLSRTVSNVICSLVFGQRFGYDDDNFLHLLNILSAVLRFGSSPCGQLYNIFPWLMERLPGRQQVVFGQMDELRGFVMKKIHEHQETIDPGNPRDFTDSFLTRLNQEKDVSSSEFHYENLVSTVLDLFLAGTETTSTTLRYAFMLLLKYPDIQEHVQQEIDTVIGRQRVPQMEDRKYLPFTEAVIHEVQRFLDIAPLNLPHYATKNISFRGYTIPQGTVILPMLHSVLRDQDHWATPTTFNPNHFLDQNGNFQKNPAFLAFSAGKRACVGESLARMEIFLFLVSLLQHFSFSCPGGPDSIDLSPEFSSFTNVPRHYQLIATPR
ncbi:cytochrome P450 2F3-like isoform X2 [Salvelinus namaycush]|uniref:unspecific monooxygenase n=1 Tax=Salvelinus namaycush TaxID=8040 RepID=A0A8U0QWY3_SALNM|nr:cytochrome P450 2F3-like isoform X2 [Salvelinus namaycush]